MICEICGRRFEFGNRPDGLPNGCGFQTADGVVHDVCTECIMGDRQSKLEKVVVPEDTKIAIDHIMQKMKVIEAVKTIKDYCACINSESCYGCMFNIDNECMFYMQDLPCLWEIDRIEQEDF